MRENLAANVKRLRDERGWSQGELARRAGVSQRTVSNIEAGAETTLDKIEKLALAFKVSPFELLMGHASEGDSLADRLILAVAEHRVRYRTDKR